jgi:multidrug resistance efflux pump
MPFDLPPGRLIPAAFLVAGCLVLTACGQSAPQALAATPQAAAIAKGAVSAKGGFIPVSSPRDGQIVQVAVEEGAHVRAGEVLAVLDRARADLLAQEALSEAAKSDAAVSVAQARWKLADVESSRLSRLVAGDAATGQEAEQARLAADTAKAGVEEARQAAAAAGSRAKLAALERSLRVVRSPVSGVVLRRQAVVGGTASAGAGAPLFILAPDGPPIVRAELDEAFADKVEPGMAAWITDATGDGRAYRGHVLQISPAFDPATSSEDGGRADTRVLRMVVAIDEPTRLRFGQRVLARLGP